jgi:hypothetical protein
MGTRLEQKPEQLTSAWQNGGWTEEQSAVLQIQVVVRAG